MDARKQRYGAGDLRALFGDASKLVAAKGKKEVEFDLRKVWPDAEELEKAVIGPTGNLRAPVARVGKTVIVGFGEGVYSRAFG